MRGSEGSAQKSAPKGLSASSAPASSLPVFASTPAAFRFSPASFARFIADPLNAALNSSCVIASKSRARIHASFPASTARGANSGTFNACANFTFQGHTSWQECRDARFAIALGTEVRTLGIADV